MGSSWSRETAWSGTSDWIVTQNEVKGALSGFEAWQKEQDASKVNQRALPTNGPLLDRMGGADYVKRVAERFYHKLYADEQLAPFLGEHDVVSLRAKQNAFLIWAFGPPNRPYPGRHLRTAHLRLIKQKGFTVEHFEMGLKHFEEALKEMDAPPSVVRDALMKLRPYKTVVFTPSSARDAEEELRWVKEERMRAQREQRALHKTHSTASATSVGSGTAAPAGGAAGGVAAEGGSAGRAVSRSADSGTSAPRPPAGSAPGTADQGAAAAAQASQQHGSGTGGISDSDQSVSSSAAARAAGPQCPFTGGRVSRPSSSTVVVPPASTSADNSVTTPTSEAAPSPVATPTRSTPPKGPSGAASGGPPLSRLSGSQLFPPPFPAGGVNSPARGSGRAGPGSASGSFSGPSGGVMAAAAPGLLGGTGSGHGSFSSSQVPLPPALAGLPPPPPLPPLHMLATRGAGNGPPSGSGTPRSTSQRGMAVGGSAQAVSLSGALPSGSAGGCAVGSPLASAGGSGAFSRRSGGRSSFDFGSGPSTIPGVRQPSPSHLSQMTPGSMPGGVVSAAAEVAAAPSSSPVVRAAPSMAWAASAATGAKSGPPKAAAAANAPAAAAAGGDVSGGLKKLAPPAAAAREGSDAAAAAAAAAQQPRPVERWAQPAAATPGSGGGGGAGSGSGTAGTGTGTAGTGSHSPNYHMQFMKPPSPGHMSSGMSSPGAMKRLA